MNNPSKDYLEMIKKHIDSTACIDSAGNVIYIDQHIITVSPDECKQIMNEMAGVDIYANWYIWHSILCTNAY